MFSKSGVGTFGFGFWASRETCSYSLSSGLVFGFVDTLGWLVCFQIQVFGILGLGLAVFCRCTKPKPNQPTNPVCQQSQRLTPKTNCKNRSPGKPKTQTQKSQHLILKTFKNPRQNPKKPKKTNLRTLLPGRPLLKKLVMGIAFVQMRVFNKASPLTRSHFDEQKLLLDKPRIPLQRSLFNNETFLQRPFSKKEPFELGKSLYKDPFL